MDAPDLHAVGLDFDNWASLLSAVDEAGLFVVDGDDSFKLLGVHTDPSGARLVYLDLGEGERFTQVSTVCPGGHTVDVIPVRAGLAMVDVLIDGQTSWRLLCDVDDPHSYAPRTRPTRCEDYHLGAIGYRVGVYPDEAAWRAAEETSQRSVRMGVRHLASPWLFAIYAGQAKPEDATSAASMSGVVTALEERTTQLTGQRWWCATIDCGMALQVALPGDLSPAPTVGSIVSGTVLTTGSTGVWEHVHG